MTNLPLRARIAGAAVVLLALGGGGYKIATACGCATPTFTVPPTTTVASGTGTYHVFANNAAGVLACTRNSGLVNYATALAAGNVCRNTTNPQGTFAAAYQAAQPGDLIGVEPGTYVGQDISSQFTTAHTASGGCHVVPSVVVGALATDTSSCITFEPDGGAPPLSGAVAVTTVNSRGGNGILISEPYVRVRNMTAAGINFTWINQVAGVTCTAGTSQPHDMIADGIESTGVSAAGGVSNVKTAAIVNSSFDGNQDTAGGSNVASVGVVSATGNGNCNTTSQPSLTTAQLIPSFVFDRDTWNGLVATCNPCGGVTPHEQEIHVRMANDSQISNSKFVNASGYDLNIEGQGFGGTVRNLDNLDVIGNVFGATCANQGGLCQNLGGLDVICHTNGDTFTNSVIAYNSVAQGPLFQITTAGGSNPNGCSLGVGPSTFAGSVVVGNDFGIAATCQVGNGVAFRYNRWSSGTCDATDSVGATGWTSPGFPNYDFTLTAGSGAANFVPTSVTVSGLTVPCPLTDLAAGVRPALGNTKCAVGAYDNQTGGTGGTGLTSGLSAITTISSAGATRSFKTYWSGSACPASGCPLVVFNPGSPGGACPAKTSFNAMMDCDLGTSATSGTGQVFVSGWPATADAHGLILVYPEEDPATCFSGGTCGGVLGPDLSTVIQDIVAYVEAHANIDPSKVFMTGFSQGGYITMAAECQQNAGIFAGSNNYTGITSLFHGFATEAGAQGGTALSNHSEPPVVNTCVWDTTPKVIVHITSKGDTQVPDDPAGTNVTLRCAAQTAGSNCVLQAPTTAAAYAAKWGCAAPAVSTISTAAPPTSYTNYTTTIYQAGCATGAFYEWISLGSGSGANGPTHSLVNYNTAAGAGSSIPELVWAIWAAH